VLRRYRDGAPRAYEAHVMEHARGHGYPVPRVVDVRESALVLERVDGPTMLEDLRRRPWLLRRHAMLLAELHARLHRIPAPRDLPQVGPGETLLHLDFHPHNVLLTDGGPVVLDWTNARRGDPALDVALTWVILATSGGRLGRLFLRRYLLRRYLHELDTAAVREALPRAAQRRIGDRNVTEAERRRVRLLVEREARDPS
jgi:aminoglycoside phosphotransferase (APT) family kinase protein